MFISPLCPTSYYQSKFEAKTPEDIVSKASDAAQKYFEGLVWVFRYYMQGCASWKWFCRGGRAPLCRAGLQTVQVV